MPTIEERTAMAKLDALKDIRCKTIDLEKLRLRLFQEVDSFKTEENCLAEYRREMELLQQEKMAHVEELRQIHSDINAIENVIKQAEEAKRNAGDGARRAFEDYGPLKFHVDQMRTQVLGLEKLPDIADDVKVKLDHLGIVQKSIKFTEHHSSKWHHPFSGHLQLAAQFADAQMRGGSVFNIGKHNFSGFIPRTHYPGMNGGLKSNNSFLSTAGGPSRPDSKMPVQSTGPPPFRQQAPPMKLCLSCHQQIHRNAPICPLCKAKSRSKNPKKPKKKE